jgi:penicillin-binding protein 2
VGNAVVREYGPEKIRTIDLKRATVERLHKALVDVVQGPRGTGGAARSSLVEIAGKTGTAQVIEMKGAYLKSEQLAHFHRDHAWFVAYAPAQNPRIALVVLVEHGGHGGDAAAPMAKKVIEKYMELQARPVEQQQARMEGATRAD